MLILEDVPSNGTETAVTLHGDIPMPTHPKTKLTKLMELAYKVHHISQLTAALGISRLEVHQLRNGSKTCDIEEVKRLLREGGIDYE